MAERALPIKRFAIKQLPGFVLGIFLTISVVWLSAKGPTTTSQLIWCDAAHEVPYVAPDKCGNYSSCEWAPKLILPVPDWNAFCAEHSKPAR